MTQEKSALKAQYNHNGFALTVIWYEGTNVFGKGERYVVSLNGPRETQSLGYQTFEDAFDKYADLVAHINNWDFLAYRRAWFEDNMLTPKDGDFLA